MQKNNPNPTNEASQTILGFVKILGKVVGQEDRNENAPKKKAELFFGGFKDVFFFSNFYLQSFGENDSILFNLRFVNRCFLSFGWPHRHQLPAWEPHNLPWF